MTTCDQNGCGKEVDCGEPDFRLSATGEYDIEVEKDGEDRIETKVWTTTTFRISGPFDACVEANNPIVADSAEELLTILGVPKASWGDPLDVLEDRLGEPPLIAHSASHLLMLLQVPSSARTKPKAYLTLTEKDDEDE